MKPTRNRYTCQKCGKWIITMDVDEGATPFMLGCRATEGCDGIMQSGFYRVRDDEGPATFLWRKPTKAEYKTASKWMRRHFDAGGLDIYPANSTD